MLFISDVQYYVHIKLCKTAGNIHLSKIIGTLIPEYEKLKQKLYLGYHRNRLEGDQHEFSENKIALPKSVTIKFRDKFKIRHMMKREPLLFHIILRQGFNWFTFVILSLDSSGVPPCEHD